MANNFSINFITDKHLRSNKILMVFWNDYFNSPSKYSDDFDYANELMHMTSMLSNSVLYHNYDRILGYNLEEMLHIAKSSGFIHVFVQTPGSIIQTNIIKTLDKFVRNNNYFITGHILDGKVKNKYLYLHEQNFLINVSYLDIAPSIDWKCKDKKVLQDYERSLDNYHDNYTPFWVKGIESKIEVSNYNWSANWLNFGLKNNLLLVFDNEMRSSKYHLYPENHNHRETWLDQCQEDNQLSRILNSSYKKDKQHHIFNNENFSRQSAKAVTDNIDCLVVPASGFYSVHAAKYFNPKKIIFYDIDEVTLSFRKAINEQWEPGKSFNDIEIQGLHPFNDENVGKVQLLDNDWFTTQDQLNEFWIKYKEIEKEYHVVDIVGSYPEFYKTIPTLGNVYVWLNSIYTYSTNIWNHRPKKIFESYQGLLLLLSRNKNNIWIDCKEPSGQYRCFEVHRYIPDAVMMPCSNYRKFM